MNSKPLDKHSEAYLAYIKLQLEKAKDRVIPLNSTAQAPSTLATLARDPKEDEAWFNRPIPTNAQIYDEDGLIHIRLRTLEPIEIYLHKGARKWRSTHDKDGGAAIVRHSENRERAIDAFIYSPAAKLTEGQEQLLAPKQVAIEPTPPTLLQEQEEYGWDPWLAFLIRFIVLVAPLAALGWMVLHK